MQSKACSVTPNEAKAVATVETRTRQGRPASDFQLPFDKPYYQAGPRKTEIESVEFQKYLYRKLIGEGRFDEALGPLRELVEDRWFAQDHDLRLLYGQALAGAGRHAEASAQFAKCLHLSPTPDQKVLDAWFFSREKASETRSNAVPR